MCLNWYDSDTASVYALHMGTAQCKITERVFGDGTGETHGLIKIVKKYSDGPKYFWFYAILWIRKQKE